MGTREREHLDARITNAWKGLLDNELVKKDEIDEIPETIVFLAVPGFGARVELLRDLIGQRQQGDTFDVRQPEHRQLGRPVDVFDRFRGPGLALCGSDFEID
jgi:hypothetical protein